MDKYIIPIISILSKTVNSLIIHRQVITQIAKHQLYSRRFAEDLKKHEL